MVTKASSHILPVFALTPLEKGWTLGLRPFWRHLMGRDSSCSSDGATIPMFKGEEIEDSSEPADCGNVAFGVRGLSADIAYLLLQNFGLQLVFLLHPSLPLCLLLCKPSFIALQAFGNLQGGSSVQSSWRSPLTLGFASK